jgi:hypothetical protein
MLVLARPSIDLAGLPARQSQRPGGRPIAAVDELCSPRDPLANQPSQRLHYVPEKLPVPHVDQLCPCPRWNSSAHGRATTGPSPPLAGDTFGQATTANRERVSPIAFPIACLPARAPPRRRRARRRRRVQGGGGRRV